MPSKSPAQARLMAAAAHDPGFAEKVGVPTSVAREFNAADQKVKHRRRPVREYLGGLSAIYGSRAAPRRSD
jgi:hypothetical protein